jgi:hypothetical protein
LKTSFIQNSTQFYYALFGCTELDIELNWIGNSKFRMERKWLRIWIIVFGCVWNLLLELKGVPNSNFRLEAGTTELGDLLIFYNINLCICMKNSMCEYYCSHKNTYALSMAGQPAAQNTNFFG